MEYYVNKLKTGLKELNLEQRCNVFFDDGEDFIISICGYVGHRFSIKISTFNRPTILFLGYDKEVALPLSDESVDKVLTLTKRAVNFGTRIEELKERGNIYEFIAESAVTAEKVKSLYQEAKKDEGKYVSQCTLLCSDFLGKNVFKVQAL